MALTVEELQIVLSCDATTAQAVLDKMEATVKAYTDKFQKYFNNMGGKKNNGVPTLDNVVKDVKRQTKNLSKYGADWKKQYEKTFGETFDSSIMKAKIRAAAAKPRYASSGEKYVGRGGGMGDPDYFKNSAAYKATSSKQIPNENVLELGAKVRATLEDSLGKVNSISDATRSKIADAIQKVKQLGAEYTKAVEAGGNDSKASNAALEKFKKSIYAADQYSQKLDKIAAKEQETGTDSSEEKRVSMFSRIAAAASAVKGKIASIGQAVKKAFQGSILGKFLKQLSRTMMRMAAMKLIRGTLDGIKQGLEMLGRAGGTAGKAMNQVKAAGQSVKAALGVALMPVVKALAPVFYQVAQAVTAAGNAIARFLATLLGQSSYTAASISSSMDSVSSSYGGAGKAAKNALADFDEINLITKSSGGGGGSGSAGDTGFSTVTEELVGSGSSLAQQLRDAFLAGDWEGVGKGLQTGLGNINTAFEDWLKGFKELHIGERFANLINGFFSPDENGEYPVFKNFGTNLGTFLGTLGANLVSMILDVNWGDVAGAFAAFISGFWSGLKSAWDEEMEHRRQEGKPVPLEGAGTGWVGSDTDDPTAELGGEMLTPEEFAAWWSDYKKKIREKLGIPEGQPILWSIFTGDTNLWDGLIESLNELDTFFDGFDLKWERFKLTWARLWNDLKLSALEAWNGILKSMEGNKLAETLFGVSSALEKNQKDIDETKEKAADLDLKYNVLTKTLAENKGKTDDAAKATEGLSYQASYAVNTTRDLQGSLDKLGETNVEPQVNPKVGETIETNDLFSDRPLSYGHGKKVGEGTASIPIKTIPKVDAPIDSTDLFATKGGVITNPTGGITLGLGMRPQVEGPIKSTDLVANSSGVTEDKNGLGISFKVRPEVEGGNTTVTALQSIITGFNEISGKAKKATLSVKMSGAKESAVTKMSDAVSKFFDGSKTSSITINQDGASLTQIQNAADAIKNFPKSVTVQATIEVVNAAALKKALQDALTASAKITVNGKNAGSFKVNANNVQTMASGGIAYGITSAIIGEYAGASSNPEVVAPLSKLQGILESSGTVSKDTMTRDQANTMIQLLQRIERKEIEVKPSVGLGQVVQQSLGAYART